jgi:hypothetical protein
LTTRVTVPDPLQRRRREGRGAAQGLLGEHGGQPLDRRGVCGDEPVGEPGDLGLLGRLREHLQVTGAVEQLVLELQVLQQRLRQRLDLVHAGLEQGGEAAQRRSEHVRHATEVAQGLGDEDGAVAGLLAVLHKLAAHSVGAGLRDAGLRDGDLGLGQLQQGPQLLDGLGVVSHGVGVLRLGCVRCVAPILPSVQQEQALR